MSSNSEVSNEEANRTVANEKEPEINPSEDKQEDVEDVEASAEVHFEPVVKLDIVEVKTLEEEEETFFKARAKLFRYDKPTSQWKERGTGEVKLLQHTQSKKIRILMRRDQTHKICANHLVSPQMKLAPNVGSDRSWVWSAPADMADGEPTPELLAIRFASSEIAGSFKSKFEEAQSINASLLASTPSQSTPAGDETGQKNNAGEKVDQKEDPHEAKDASSTTAD